MDRKTFESLNPEIHRLIRLIVCGEATEVQINYVLQTNNLDRKTLDDAIGFLIAMDQKIRRITLLIVFLTILIFNLLITL